MAASFGCLPFFAIILVLVLMTMGDSEGKRPASDKKSGGYEMILQTSKSQCSEKSIKAMEAKMVRLMGFGPRSRPFPDSIEVMRVYCTETIRLVKEIETYSKECVKKEIANIIAIFLYSIRGSMTRPYCGRNIKKNAPQIRDSACLNKHFFSQYRCFEVFNNATAKLVNLKDDKVKIPHTCCNFNRFMACLENLLDSQSCTAVHKEQSMNLLKGATAGLTDVICGEFTDETDRCDTIGVSPSAPNSKKYRSFIFALIDLIASMSSFNI